MGARNSIQVPDPERACALIQLRSWRGCSLEQLVAVPVHESVFENSPSHPLFKLLHAARTEPAVRHWYAGATSAEVKEEESIDRSVTLEPELSPEELYQEIFSSDAGTGQSVSRWMLLTIGINSNPFRSSFLTVEQVTAIVEDPPLTAEQDPPPVKSGEGPAAVAGYVESSHGSLSTTLRYWMVKSFSTEGRSLVLFQAAAFMEARKMKYHKTPRTPSEVVEFALRVGDISSLRMLELTFRRLLPDTCSDNMMPAVTVQPRGPFLTVRLSGDPLVDIFKQLEVSIDGPESASPKGLLAHPSTSVLTLAVEHRQVTHIATPFAPLVEEAKAIWNKENAIVTQAQPNQRQPKRTHRKKNLTTNGGASAVTQEMGDGPKGIADQDDAALARALSQQFTVTSNERNLGPKGSKGGSFPHQHAPPAKVPMLAPQLPPRFQVPAPFGTPLAPVAGAALPVPPAPATVSVMPVNAPFYKLPANTPCNYLHVETATWFPMLYPEQTARLTLANTQHQSGKVYLETVDCLKLNDGKGSLLSIQPNPSWPGLPQDTVKIVVNSGTFALQCTGESSNQTVVQLLAP